MTNSTKFSKGYSLTQEQWLTLIENVVIKVFEDELNSISTESVEEQEPFEPPFTERECRNMKLPQLKYEVSKRELTVVGTGKGGAAKKIDYIDALLGRQKPKKMIRSLD
jgi:hypothetical protein